VGVVDRQLRLQLHRRRVSTPTDFTADDGPIVVEVLVHMYEPNEQGRESSGCGFPGAGVGSFLTCAVVPRMRAAGKNLGIILSSSSRCAHDCAQQPTDAGAEDVSSLQSPSGSWPLRGSPCSCSNCSRLATDRREPLGTSTLLLLPRTGGPRLTHHLCGFTALLLSVVFPSCLPVLWMTLTA
jgi:hypothetical protein